METALKKALVLLTLAVTAALPAAADELHYNIV